MCGWAGQLQMLGEKPQRTFGPNSTPANLLLNYFPNFAIWTTMQMSQLLITWHLCKYPMFFWPCASMCLFQLHPSSDLIAQPPIHLPMVIQKWWNSLGKSNFSQARAGDVSPCSITRVPNFHLFFFGRSAPTANLPGRPWSLQRCMLSAGKSNPILSTCSNIRSLSSSTTICCCVISLAWLAIRLRRKGSIPPATGAQGVVSSAGGSWVC